MIWRAKYINNIVNFIDNPLIKVITGVRRCGKSVVLEQLKSLVQKKSNNVVYMDFDNRASVRNIRKWEDIVDYVGAKRGEGFCYVFLDEVQNINDWQFAVRSLARNECSVFVTGSNSKLLSSEIANEISGRFVSFRIRPFVYRECKEYSQQLGKDYTLEDYIVWGGFPQAIEQKTQSDLRSYINSLDQTIVLNDVLSRYNIMKSDDFKKVLDFILTSNSRIYSPFSISKYIKSNNHIDISANTIQKWIGYLKEAYIIDEIPRFSTKAKRRLENSKKLYNCDVCLNSIRQNNLGFDITHNFENVVYNELLFMDYELEVYSDIDGEIDFIATKDNKRFYIQVAYSLVEEKTRIREFAPFKKLDNLNSKIIISKDDFDFSTSNVRHIKFKDFVSMNSL